MARDQAFYDRFDEAWQAAYNEGNVDGLDEFYAPDFVRHHPPFPDVVGLEAYKKWVAGVHESYPDSHITYYGGIWQGDFSAGYGRWSGTKAGAPMLTDVQTTGQKLDYMWCSFDRWVGDKCVEEWSLNDFLTMMKQIGYTFVPPEEQK